MRAGESDQRIAMMSTASRATRSSRPVVGHAALHLPLFLVGWIYYLVVPLVAGFSGALDAMDAAEPVARYFSGQQRGMIALISYVALMPLAFIAGDRLSRILRTPRPRPGIARRSHWLLLCAYAVLLAAFTLAARDVLFAGYIDGVDSSLTGPIATMAMVILFHYLSRQADECKSEARATGLLLVAACVVLLGMGGRLYMVTALVAIYFHWWHWLSRDRAARIRSLVLVFAAPLALALIGMWRIGSIDFTTLGFYLFAEAFFSSISALSLMLGNTWSWIDAPRDFFSAFLNIVPTVIWSDKGDFLVSLSDSLDFESPFGAMSILTSTIGKFGFFGGLAFIAAVGYLLGRARLAARYPTARALYCYLAAMLPFEFFRDPMQIQVKLVFTGFLLFWLYRFLARRWVVLPRDSVSRERPSVAHG